VTGWDEIVARAEGGPVSAGSMFGSRGLRTGTKFFAIWWHDRLVLKLPADRREALVSGGHAVPFEPMPGRPMNGWVVVGDAVDRHLLVDEARAFVAAQSS
jgi:TfoX/Sxy family transcriptional regulator of competence genes